MSSVSVVGDVVTKEDVLSVASERRGAVLPDWLGIVASIGCAIHCAAMPFVIAFLPYMGLSFLADEAFHKVMVGVCTLLALAAFVPGWRKHRRWLPAGIATGGLAMITVAAFALEDTCACCAHASESPAVSSESAVSSTACTDQNCQHCRTLEKDQPVIAAAITPGFVAWITPAGGMLLVCAHLINHRLTGGCNCCATENADND